MTDIQNIANPWPAPVAQGPINATVTIPGSKSLSNRYLILAALGTSPVTIEGLLRSRDTELMMAALQQLGVHCATDPQVETTVTLTPPTDGHFTGNVTINCGLAGTVMRFVPGLALFADGPVRFDGDVQAYHRPMKPLLDGLEQLGAHIDYEGEEGYLPFTLTPPSTLPAQRAEVTIDSSSSSQFISGLLLIASRLPHGMELVHMGERLPSMPHIRMTMEDVRKAGGTLAMPVAGQWILEHAELCMPATVVVEPDLSNAAPFLGAALIAGGSVSVPNWPLPTTQPGGLLPDMLRAFGAEVSWNGESWDEVRGKNDNEAKTAVLTVRCDGNVHGLGEYDLSAAGEIAPSIAAIAVFGDIPTVLTGIGHLRGHETDRLKALCTEINRIGSHAEELSDGIAITTVPPQMMHGAVMDSYADHRMATFAAMVGLQVPGIGIKDVTTTRKTIPDFTGMWNAMLNQ